jgi:prepilin-type N-terminal cleavage/methylation domain-containing protein
MKISLKAQAKAGFTIVELAIVVTVIGLLVGIGIPNYMRARDNSRLNLIYSNLREIENAKSQWALDNHKQTGDDVTDIALLTGYLRGGAVHDAIRETYSPNPVGTPAEANLPVGVPLGTYAAGAAIPAP